MPKQPKLDFLISFCFKIFEYVFCYLFFYAISWTFTIAILRNTPGKICCVSCFIRIAVHLEKLQNCQFKDANLAGRLAKLAGKACKIARSGMSNFQVRPSKLAGQTCKITGSSMPNC